MTDFQIGEKVTNPKKRNYPDCDKLKGMYIKLNKLKESDFLDLYNSLKDAPKHDWFYMFYGPFNDFQDFKIWAMSVTNKKDPQFLIIRSIKDNECRGFCSLLNINEINGTAEIGHVQIAPKYQRTPTFTEIIYLTGKKIFSIDYRRFEWKCNSLNYRSVNSAKRHGFNYEGTFKNHMIVKERNRDTSWFSATNNEWTKLEEIYRKWLSPDNFDKNGIQKTALSQFTKKLTRK